MSVKYNTINTLFSNRGPKSSQPVPWYRRKVSSINTSYVQSTLSLGSVANTKAAWTQVVSSTSSAVGMIRLRCSSYNLGNSNAILLDIGTGASGSETVIAANIAIGGGAYQLTGGMMIEIPVFIPAGTRVAVRSQSARTSFSWTVHVTLIAATPSDFISTPRSVDVLGTSTATSSATAMSGASGTYVQITSSTNKDYQALITVFSISATSAPSPGGNVYPVFTVATGAAGSEVDIGQLVTMMDPGIGTGNMILPGNAGSNAGIIRAGTRISVKHNIASSPGGYEICVIGVPYV